MLAWLWKCVRIKYGTITQKHLVLKVWSTQVLQGGRGRSAEKKQENSQSIDALPLQSGTERRSHWIVLLQTIDLTTEHARHRSSSPYKSKSLADGITSCCCEHRQILRFKVTKKFKNHWFKRNSSRQNAHPNCSKPIWTSFFIGIRSCKTDAHVLYSKYTEVIH